MKINFNVDRNNLTDLNEIIGWIDSETEFRAWTGNNFSFPVKISEFKNYYEINKCIRASFIRKDNLIGYCELVRTNIEPKEISLARVIINKNYRSNGYANLFLSEIILFCKTFGFKKIRLNVLDSNKNAILLYKKLGFVKDLNTLPETNKTNAVMKMFKTIQPS